MEQAKKFLDEGHPELALERLKKILYEGNFEDEGQIHEMFGATFHDLANADGVTQAYFSAAKTDKILRSQRTHFSNYLFALHYLPKVDAKILFETAQIYNSLYREQLTLNKKNLSITKAIYPIKIAFIAPHFLDSSSARFYEKLLTDYDRKKFFVTAWSLSEREDQFTKKIRASVDKYFDVSEISFEEIAQKIQAENVDILFDLGGHGEGGMTLQVAAYRPAKIQISGIGYFDTTGLDAIDYFLTDKFLIADNENFFTEQIFELDNAFAFQPNEKMIQAKKNSSPIPRPSSLTFGCLNNFMKITDDYLDCVKKILDQVPNSKIVFRDTTPLQSRKNVLNERLIEKFFPEDRFEIFCGANDFFDDYAKIDLILDTFPYTGGLMTALALYFEVPVLNLCGKFHYSRLGADILRISEQENFIVENVNDYIKKAVDFAQGNILQKKIRVDKLTDTKTFAENFYKKLQLNFYTKK